MIHKTNARLSKESIPLGKVSLIGHWFTIFGLQELTISASMLLFLFLTEFFNVLKDM